MSEIAMHRKIEAVAVGLASGFNYAAEQLSKFCRNDDLDNEELIGEVSECLETIGRVIRQYKQEVKELYDELFEG